jgi:spore maturation protein CgeB
MVAAGYSPSVRLFEAAACGVPVISDRWVGIETFFKLGEEILLVDTADDVLALLKDLPENRRRQIAQAARGRYFAAHTPAHRARDLETYYRALVQSKPAAALAEDVA